MQKINLKFLAAIVYMISDDIFGVRTSAIPWWIQLVMSRHVAPNKKGVLTGEWC